MTWRCLDSVCLRPGACRQQPLAGHLAAVCQGWGRVQASLLLAVGGQADVRRVSAAGMAAGALAAAPPLCSALGAVTELGCWLCSPALKHHRIQRLPGINLLVKHFQDSSFQVLLSSCRRTWWGRDGIRDSLWQGLSIKASWLKAVVSLQHCGSVAPCAHVYQHFLDVCVALWEVTCSPMLCKSCRPTKVSCSSVALKGGSAECWATSCCWIPPWAASAASSAQENGLQ